MKNKHLIMLILLVCTASILALTGCFHEVHAYRVEIDSAAARTLLSPQAMLEDWLEMKANLERYYPDATAISRLAEQERSIKAQLGQELPRFEFSLLLAQYLAAFEDGHLELLMDADDYPPELQFYYQETDGVWYIMAAAAQGAPPDHSRVISINGSSPEQWYPLLNDAISADSEYGKKASFGRWLNYYLANYLGASVLSVAYSRPSPKPGYTPGYPMETAVFLHDASGTNDFFIDQDGSACFFRFAAFEDSVEARLLLEKMFAEMQTAAVETLFIDLRGTPGGELMMALALIEAYLPVDASFADTAILFLSQNQHAAEVNNSPLLREYVLRPQGTKHTYHGAIYCLVDRNTNSAGVIFPAILRGLGLCDGVIGEPPGGNLRISSNASQFTLPNSKLKYVVPTASLSLSANICADETLIPDILVTYTAQDHADSADPFLEYIYKNLL